MAINFGANKEEFRLIGKIADRAITMFKETQGRDIPRLDVTMDITACHLNGCPLKLQELLDADDFNFAHDVFGIMGHIDRDTGKLTRCFLPRFAKLED